jgi:hypothetical protein
MRNKLKSLGEAPYLVGRMRAESTGKKFPSRVLVDNYMADYQKRYKIVPSGDFPFWLDEILVRVGSEHVLGEGRDVVDHQTGWTFLGTRIPDLANGCNAVLVKPAGFVDFCGQLVVLPESITPIYGNICDPIIRVKFLYNGTDHQQARVLSRNGAYSEDEWRFIICDRDQSEVKPLTQIYMAQYLPHWHILSPVHPDINCRIICIES